MQVVVADVRHQPAAVHWVVSVVVGEEDLVQVLVPLISHQAMA